MSDTDAVMLFSTCSRAQAAKIAETLIQKRLAACVNIAEVRSVYRWKGELQHDEEALLIVKTSAIRREETIHAIKEMHSYELPEIVVIQVAGGYVPYLEWVREETSG